MASTRTLGQLFRALGSQDLRTAHVVARTIAEDEERRGHRSAAALLRGALARSTSSTHFSGPMFDVSSALIAEKPGPPFADVVLTDEARRELRDVHSEWEFRTELAGRDLPRRTKVVFSGPPGCGKTLTARALGAELGLPVVTVRFSNLVGAYLGQTGANVRAVFAFAEATPCVLLLDEFDAIARARGRHTDVGELDRIVISLLQELDHTVPKGVVIAATNSPESLDRAIWRRFDLHIEFPYPSRTQLKTFARVKLHGVRKMPARDALPRSARSFADAEKWAMNFHRQQVLQELRRENGASHRP